MHSEITAVIKETITEMKADEDINPSVSTPKDINDGFCSSFAVEVYKRLGEPDGMQLCVGGVMNALHFWIEYEDVYYDAETPAGVADWRKLPFWKRRNTPSDFDVESFAEYTPIY